MSELLIRNIPAPTSDQIIVIARNEDGQLCARLNPSHDECHEVIELPPHGRLIDADDANNHIVGYVDLRDCPTVIPAEEGEE